MPATNAGQWPTRLSCYFNYLEGSHSQCGEPIPQRLPGSCGIYSPARVGQVGLCCLAIDGKVRGARPISGGFRRGHRPFSILRRLGWVIALISQNATSGARDVKSAGRALHVRVDYFRFARHPHLNCNREDLGKRTKSPASGVRIGVGCHQVVPNGAIA